MGLRKIIEGEVQEKGLHSDVDWTNLNKYYSYSSTAPVKSARGNVAGGHQSCQIS